MSPLSRGQLVCCHCFKNYPPLGEGSVKSVWSFLKTTKKTFATPALPVASTVMLSSYNAKHPLCILQPWDLQDKEFMPCALSPSSFSLVVSGSKKKSYDSYSSWSLCLPQTTAHTGDSSPCL